MTSIASPLFSCTFVYSIIPYLSVSTMCVCVRACSYLHIYMYIFVFMCVYTSKQMYTCMHAHIYLSSKKCMGKTHAENWDRWPIFTYTYHYIFFAEIFACKHIYMVYMYIYIY